MNIKDPITTLILECPRINLVSQVVENALQDALLSVFTFGENISQGVYLGVYKSNLDDQFVDYGEGDVCFEGTEQEMWEFQKDPIRVRADYLHELNQTLMTINRLNKVAIEITQRQHYRCRFDLLAKLPNHWIIALKGD